MNNKRFDIRSAYGQLILLVFLPICLLAAVGAALVYNETWRAVHNEQEALAKALLIRYQPVVKQNLPSIIDTKNTQVIDQKNANVQLPQPIQKSSQTLQDVLLAVNNEAELKRIAIINQDGKVVDAAGYGAHAPWVDINQTNFHKNTVIPRFGNNAANTDGASNKTADTSRLFIEAPKTSIGTPYGMALGEFEGQKLWLFVDMDNQPLQVAKYRIILALAITGLLTILLLLLSLNIYSRRWIAPIYEMRLYLQRTSQDNLYQPIPVVAQGELNLLQQDLVKALRRLHSSFQDLTSHAEQTEDDLRQAFDEMELQTISIRNARDAAVSASAAKSAFLANISHELRTPLNSIDGFINVLARHGELSSEQDLYVQTIRKSSAHLLALVNDVLDFSKIEAGKLVLDSHEFNIYNTIYEVVDMLSPLSSEKGLRMAVVFYNDVPLNITGDALRVKQVLTNLVGNAIKFTDVGEIVVTVSLDDKQDNHLKISVQDTGKGVSQEVQKHLFKSFSQGDPSITRQYGGTGLGLVVSKQLTHLMGGQIGFYDNAAQNIGKTGSTFWFDVPTNVDVFEAENASDIELPALELPQNLYGTQDDLNILVWINHTVSAQILQASLQPLPINITQTNSLASTLDKLKELENHWDWVIIDSVANETEDDMLALLKQVRLHYQGRLMVYGYQVALDTKLLTQYKAMPLYEPLDKRQLYSIFDSTLNAKPEPDSSIPRWHGCRVLAVDDHQPNLLVLQTLLAEEGIEVITANSGFEAIDIVNKQQSIEANSDGTYIDKPIDLIFMDIQMPRMSGHQATEQIRKIETREPRIPIIAITAHGMADERDNLIRSGMDGYVGKPINQAQLKQILQKWLGEQTENMPTGIELNTIDTDTSIMVDAGMASADEHMQSSNDSHTPNEVLHAETESKNTSELKQDVIIDWEDALTRAANKPELASQLITMMIDSIDTEKQALIEAWQANDREQLAQVSHRILGASRYTGVPQLRDASQNFEDKCLLDVKLNSVAQMAQLKPSYELLLLALDNLANVDLTKWEPLKYHQLKEEDMTWKMI